MCDGAECTGAGAVSRHHAVGDDASWRKRARMLSLDPLLPAARFLSSEAELRRSAVGFIGYGDTRPGDRVLILVDTEYDPRIPDAVAHALRERGATVDVMVEDAGPERTFDEITEIEAIIRRVPLRVDPRRWDNDHPAIPALNDAVGYDLVIHGKGGPIPRSDYRFEAIPWLDGELFASDVTDFPREVHSLVNERTWRRVWESGRKARVRVTDPEGTDISWTLHEGYFDGTRLGFTETPYWGHLMMHPAEPLLPNEDASGVLSGTTSHFSRPFPRIEIEIRDGRLEGIRGGGAYGEAWQALHDETSSIQYPGFPRPGLFWLCELALGTHPKVRRPEQIHMLSSGGFEVERRRAGIAHAGVGSFWHSETEYWAGERGLPYGHLHVHMQLPTVTLEGPGGEFTVVEDGRLTALDDPEVRDVAAKHGDPDAILSDSWIPRLPGINAGGSYEDYARDPASFYYGDERGS